jgi:hypothetical protein
MLKRVDVKSTARRVSFDGHTKSMGGMSMCIRAAMPLLDVGDLANAVPPVFDPEIPQ